MGGCLCLFPSIELCSLGKQKPTFKKIKVTFELDDAVMLIIQNVVCYVHSNASDALDKLRFLSVTQPDLLKGAADLDIRIQTDKENGIVTIT